MPSFTNNRRLSFRKPSVRNDRKTAATQRSARLPLWTSTLGGTAFFSVRVPFTLVGVDVTGSWSRFPSTLWSANSGDVALVGVGVIGLPSLISSTIWSASLDRSPSGLKGFSHPSALKQHKKNTINMRLVSLLLSADSRTGN